MRSLRDQRGTAVVEFLWLGLILLVPLLYIVLAAFEAQRSAYAASSASRSASRAFVAAPDQRSGFALANVAARLAFSDQGLDGAFELRISCTPRPRDCLSPGSVITAEVATSSALPLMPPVFGGDPPAIAITAQNRSPYGSFREGRP